ncbi:MAG TPA: sulfur carrier protein ThiS [Mycobacteriales bacterium]|jgi:sulfur carrier protein|nr:sulfur carrier protein ThiS [Mycobacteriales bacterium]
MQIVVNGAPTELADATTVDQLVSNVAKRPQGIAVAVNRSIIPRSQWRDTQLRDHDQVEVLTAAPGG